jgi:hypothetical protein
LPFIAGGLPRRPRAKSTVASRQRTTEFPICRGTPRRAVQNLPPNFFVFLFHGASRAGSLRLEMERLHDRRPFLDVGTHQIGEVLRRAALGHIAEPRQRLPGGVGLQG